MRTLLAILFLVFSIAVHAQQPSHFVIGAQELAGIDVYNLIQDDEHNYWIATDNGLYMYDGHTFTQVNCAEMRDNSLFGFEKDSKGRIYLHNLNGQIFYIENKQCRVYTTLPDSLVSPEIFLQILDGEKLIVSCREILEFSDAQTFRPLGPDSVINYSGLKIKRLADGRLISYDWNEGRLLEISSAGIRAFEPRLGSGYHIYFAETSTGTYGFDVHTRITVKVVDDELVPVDFDIQQRHSAEIIRVHSIGNQLWALSQSTGCKVFDSKLNPKYGGKYIFPDEFISASYFDFEGNILLGTFGSGIIVIPNRELVDMSYPLEGSKVTRIECGPDSSLILGTLDGKILQVFTDDSLRLLQNDGIKNVNLLRYLEDPNAVISNQPNLSVYQFKSGKSDSISSVSVKDVEAIGPSTYLVATNTSAHLYVVNHENIPDFLQGRVKQEGSLYYVDSVMGRTYCVHADIDNETIYLGRAAGLQLSKGKGQSKDIVLGDEVVLANDIRPYNGRVYVGTNLHGVLIFENDSIVGQWTVETGLASNTVQQIQVHDDIIYLATSNGFQLVKPNGQVFLLLNRTDGLLSNNVADFAVQNGVLWLVVQNQIQRIPLDQLIPVNFIPSVRIENLFVNDSLLDYRTSTSFTSDQRKFRFAIGGPSLKYWDEIIYEYRLKGLDDNWQQNPYDDNTVEYKSLPSGDFEFQVRAICRGVESETVSYSFRIYAPFWQRWWFITLVSCCFVAITFLVYRIQIKRQKRKAQQVNELNASKLTAIQSQMNPHFIFNALNSIQDLVLKQDTENSYSYIVKFSSLVRRTLNYSDKDLIDFDSELKLIDLYLSLEKLRFKDDFDYSFETEDMEDVLVPPMLIQPFIENSLHHGLLHKEGKKEIKIRFELEDVLICTITDNGVGRVRSREIRERQNKTHESFSGNAIKKRFEILRQHYGGDLGFSYTDLYDGDVAIGTKVELRIPMRNRF